MSFSRILLTMLIGVSLLSGCAKKAPAPPPAEQVPEPAPEEGAGASDGPPADVEAWLHYLTVEEKVGQLLWIGLPAGTDLDARTKEMVEQGKVGGVIYFGRQGSDPAALRALSESLQSTAQGRDRFTPGLLISIDYEGGLVQRFGAPFTTWPGAMAVGATRSEAYAEQVGKAMARELRAVGINMDMAPDADVNNNPRNPVIGVRSFGEEPPFVATMVAAAVKGLQSEGVSAVAKHFLGHGDTDVDSHMALPMVGHDLDRLNAVELVPFRKAIEADVDAIMAAHILFPAVATDGLPASLSPKVLHELLRSKMGYGGLIVTDALDGMKAITDNYGDEALVMALQAGVDALLLTESFDQQPARFAMVVAAVADGRITEERLNDAVRHNLTLKAKRALLPTPGANSLAALTLPPLTTIGQEAHRQLAVQVGAEALTLVRNQDLPLKLTQEQMLLVIGPSYADGVSATEGVATALGLGVKPYHENVREVLLERRPTEGSIAAARQLASQAGAILYGVENGHLYPEHQAFVNELIATGKPVILVGLGEPYDLTKLSRVQNYIAAYGYQAPSMQGVGALLFGQAQPKGRLPVSIPGLYPVGHGLSY